MLTLKWDGVPERKYRFDSDPSSFERFEAMGVKVTLQQASTRHGYLVSANWPVIELWRVNAYGLQNSFNDSGIQTVRPVG